MLKKICCFGNTASGKSYLSEKLAQDLNLPHISLDQIFWQENWTHISKAEFMEAQGKILAEEAWVLDGTFAELGLRERFEASDLVILLDSRPFDSLHRALSRRGKEKDRLPNGADDQKLGFVQSLRFLIEILTFNLRDRRQILKLAKAFPTKFVFLKDWQAEAEFLNHLTEKLQRENKGISE